MQNIRTLLKRHSEIAWGVGAGLLLGIGFAIFTVINTAPPKSDASPVFASRALFSSESPRQRAAAGVENASDDVRYMANWIVESRDALGVPFIIVDKRDAKVHVFDKDARLQGSSPILLGSAMGDDTVPGIGLRPVEQVRPEERTTPAGRFVGERGRNARDEDVIWIDYDAAVSMHRVLTTHPEERRLERVASAEKGDKRISAGCVNVPAAFYDAYLRPAFAGHRAIIYVLPEIKSIDQVFGSHDVAADSLRFSNPAKLAPLPDSIKDKPQRAALQG